jgi:predicted LPLAT superfamily acyltransferase
MSLTKSQRLTMWVVGVLTVAPIVAMIAGGQLGYLLISAAAVAFALLRGRGARRRAERQLLARVQRVFGPVVAPTALPPYRR